MDVGAGGGAREVGAALAEARQRARLTREQVAARLGVPEVYLVDVEAGNVAAFDEPLHAEAYVRLYAREVGLDPAPLLAALWPPEPQGATGEAQPSPAQPVPGVPGEARRRGAPRLSLRTAVAIVLAGALVAATLALSPVGNGVLDEFLADESTDGAGGAAAGGAAVGDTDPGEPGERGDAGETDDPGAAVDDTEVGGGQQIERDDVAAEEGGPEDASEEAGGAGQAAEGDVDGTEVAGDVVERGDDAVDPDADAADARSPDDVEVQVLDASGDPARREAAQQWLQAQGYVIGFVDVAAATRAETVVFAEDDHPADAEALADAAPVLAEVEPAEGLGADVDVHLLVGEDWPLDP